MSKPTDPSPKNPLDYKKSGVDIEAGDNLVDWLQDFSKKYRVRPENIKGGIGGYASIYRFPFQNMKKPCLVSSTDGVGTKLKLVQDTADYRRIAQDLVGMCLNDLICTGATPLYFLDYFATGKLENEKAEAFLAGLYESLHQCDCDLIGGETAEMPGVYQKGDFDCAGFVTGVVDEDEILGAHRVKAGDIIIALASSGFHSNGYSLLRKVFEEDLDLHRKMLLEPTRLYSPFVKACEEVQVKLHALSHITGGGITNLPRVLPEKTQAHLRRWRLPDAFAEVQKRTKMKDEELYRVLNCGVGMMVIVPSIERERVMNAAKVSGDDAFEIGVVKPSESEAPSVLLDGMMFT